MQKSEERTIIEGVSVVYPHNGKGVGGEGVEESKNRVIIEKRRTNAF